MVFCISEVLRLLTDFALSDFLLVQLAFIDPSA